VRAGGFVGRAQDEPSRDGNRHAIAWCMMKRQRT
jgi:hypothetical protein